MHPVIVMPINDPDGSIFTHLRAITPTLQLLFDHAVVSVSAATQAAQAQQVAWLNADPFFHVLPHPPDLPVGHEFAALYRHASALFPAQQILHLCFIDRVAFALQSAYRDPFCAEIRNLKPHQTPLLYQRSPAAWATHPANYRAVEQFATYVGMLLFARTLDFAWCHLALSAGQLAQIMPAIQSEDLSMLAEMLLLLRDTVQTREVDWLAWEDPFILGCDAHALRTTREQSQAETRKRLRYVTSTLALLSAASAPSPSGHDQAAETRGV
jgi:hypothetical protein